MTARCLKRTNHATHLRDPDDEENVPCQPRRDKGDAERRCGSYGEIISAFDARRKDLRLTMAEIDYRAGFVDGYASKLLCYVRNFGVMSLPTLLQTLGLEVVIRVRSNGEPNAHAD